MQEEKVDLATFSWFNQPSEFDILPNGVELSTLPKTDFWQRTHYGFSRNNGHAFLTRLWEDFSFSVKTEFVYEALYDQCGILLYLDENNWAKVSIEYEDEAWGQLGSVVTNLGWSDWGVAPIPTDVNRMFYRLSRRGTDFLFECSPDGDSYHPMRVFHMTGDLSLAKVGVYACSPSDSSFKAKFTELIVSPSRWKL